MKLSTLVPSLTTRQLLVSAYAGLSPVVSVLREDYEMASGTPVERALQALRQNPRLVTAAFVSTVSGLALRRLLAAKEERTNRAIHQLLETRRG